MQENKKVGINPDFISTYIQAHQPLARSRSIQSHALPLAIGIERDLRGCHFTLGREGDFAYQAVELRARD